MINKIVVHHEAGSNGFYGVNEYHRKLWNFRSSLGFYIGYQYYIDKTGKTWQGRADNETGAHTIGQNDNSIGICLEGNFNNVRPTPPQMIALKNLINKKMTEYSIPPANIAGHRMFANKDCPGRLVSESELKALFTPNLSYIQTMIIRIQQMLAELRTKLKGKDESQEI